MQNTAAVAGGASPEPNAVDPRLRRLYEDVLGVADAAADASFFDLGGSSLMVVHLLEATAVELGVDVSMDAFYDEPTLEGFSAAVDVARRPQPDLVAMLDAAAERGDRHRTAVVGPDGAVTYEELLDLVTRAADQPTAGGPVVRLPSSIAGARTLLCAAAAGMPLVPLDPEAAADEETVVRGAVAADRRAGPGGQGRAHRSDGPQDLLQPPPEPVDAGRNDGCGTYGMVTSGSSGRPKVVIADYPGTLTIRLVQSELLGLGPEDAYLVTAPLHHGWGWQGGLLVGLLAGATVILPPTPLRPRTLVEVARDQRVSAVMGVSFAYRLLLAGGARLPFLRMAMVGGDPLPAPVRDLWMERTGVALMDSYGASETNHVSVDTDGVPGSVGRPMPLVRVRVRGDDGTLARTGEGELVVRSPGCALRYAGDPDASAEVFGSGWVRTGDLGQIGDDGHLVLHGRADDRLNVGGSKVDPREVETVLHDALPLRDCVVVGRQGRSGLTEVWAYVVSDTAVRRADVVAAVGDRLSRHKIPSRVLQVDELPRAANGKVLRGALPR